MSSHATVAGVGISSNHSVEGVGISSNHTVAFRRHLVSANFKLCCLHPCTRGQVSQA
jgi:hypothetical protein